MIKNPATAPTPIPIFAPNENESPGSFEFELFVPFIFDISK
ncbi:10129_t:CDS:1, partial [Racocetra fulgida]